ncbi:Acetylornithine deacetylase/Succinyl-diaminopimelate desuccinylase [Spirosomataceae bacterium TFI 002]|nr:Acetylornithine deacetylase/Succinyl-diaminopimelate desuccinylase [Spirosomataceae bacterium TFI 002]
MNKNVLILSVLSLTLGFKSFSQTIKADKIKTLSEAKLLESLDEYKGFLALPNDGNYPEQIDTNLNWCNSKFQSLGFKTQELTSKSIPHLFAEKIIDPNLPTVLFYMQIDGQPVDSSKWNQESPFIATLKNNDTPIPWESLQKEINEDWKIFARSASDSKGPAMCLITALEILQKEGIKPSFNIKAIMDFQEELGSPTIAELVNNNRKLLECSYLLIMDGTRHISNLPTLTFGARGIATIRLEVFGGKENLHSGQYGNYAPNPAFLLSRLLSSMKDENGKVLVKDYYKGIKITKKDRSEFAKIPEDMADLNRELGIAQAEKVGKSYQEAMQYPSLNIRGLSAGWTGKEVRTLIPSSALAEIDLRLVKETDGEIAVERIKKHIESQGFHLTNKEPTEEERAAYPKIASFSYRIGSKPFLTPLNSPMGYWLSKAMNRLYGEGNYVKVRATGGSQPMAPFIESLDVPAVSLRIPNPDNNIHGPNENMRIGNYKEGIEMVLAVLTEGL